MTTTERITRKMKIRRLQSNCGLVTTRERLNQVEQKVQLSADAACSSLASVTGSSPRVRPENRHMHYPLENSHMH